MITYDNPRHRGACSATETPKPKRKFAKPRRSQNLDTHREQERVRVDQKWAEEGSNFDREVRTLQREQSAQDALDRAQNGQSMMNYGPILEGFAAMGIPMDEISPRENVFTFWAWKAKGRSVKKGEHGVKCVTWIAPEHENDDGELVRTGKKFCRSVTVFHISQTQEVAS